MPVTSPIVHRHAQHDIMHSEGRWWAEGRGGGEAYFFALRRGERCSDIASKLSKISCAVDRGERLSTRASSTLLLAFAQLCIRTELTQ